MPCMLDWMLRTAAAKEEEDKKHRKKKRKIQLKNAKIESNNSDFRFGTMITK